MSQTSQELQVLEETSPEAQSEVLQETPPEALEESF